MIISIRDVPPEERHLLFCTRRSVIGARRPKGLPLRHAAAINRSLAIHDEELGGATTSEGLGALVRWSPMAGAA